MYQKEEEPKTTKSERSERKEEKATYRSEIQAEHPTFKKISEHSNLTFKNSRPYYVKNNFALSPHQTCLRLAPPLRRLHHHLPSPPLCPVWPIVVFVDLPLPASPSHEEEGGAEAMAALAVPARNTCTKIVVTSANPISPSRTRRRLRAPPSSRKGLQREARRGGSGGVLSFLAWGLRTMTLAACAASEDDEGDAAEATAGQTGQRGGVAVAVAVAGPRGAEG